MNAPRLLLVIAAICVVVILIGCKQDYPERANWARAFRGEYGQLKELYLADVRPMKPAPTDPKEIDLKKIINDVQGLSKPRWSFGTVEALAALGDDRAMMTLVEMFAEGEGDSDIVEVIACGGNERAVETLLHFSDSECGKIRESTSFGLAISNCLRSDPRAVDVLLRLIEVRSPVRVSEYAAIALSNTPTSATVLHVKARDAILRYIQDPDNPLGKNLAPHLYQLLEGLEGAGVQEYIRGMVRKGIAAGYGPPIGLLHKLPEAEVIEYLEEAANDEHEWNRATAGETAAKMATPRAIAIVDRLSRDPSERVRGRIAWHLIRPFEGREAIALRLSKDPSPEVRSFSAFSLMKIDTEASRKAMLRLLNDRRGRAYAGALVVLSSRPGFIRRDDLKPIVRRFARDLSPLCRKEAVEIMSANELDCMEDVLLKLLQDRSSYVRSEAYKALHKVNPDVLKEFVLR